MTRILALVDGSAYSASVCHHSAWIAKKLGAAVDLLHLLPDHGAAGTKDFSGALTLGARSQLLQELATLDAQRAKLAAAQGHAILDDAQALIEADGAGPVTQKLRQGDLVETIRSLEPDIRALVIGKRGQGSAGAFEHLGSNLERILRSATVPVFVASRAFQPIDKVLIAFDASASAMRAVDRMAASPVFAGLEAVLVHAGTDTPALRAALEAARAKLAGGGIEASVQVVAGEPEVALERKVAAEGFGLLVMGAYGHSRIRSLIIGSTTTAMIRACKIPVLLYR
ncbi:MAG: universal stress protein [Rhodobacter sp.]|nr:universal stress protein [Rhodobacter sp.]